MKQQKGSNLSVTSPTSQLILQPFCHFTYITAHSPTFLSLHLCHSSFSNPSITYLHHSSFSNLSVTSPTSQLILQPFHYLPTSQLILQPFCHFTYVTAHSPTLPLLTYITAHSPTFPSLHLSHNSFSNPYFALPTSQLILQPFFRFSCVTSSSLNSPGEPPMVGEFKL